MRWARRELGARFDGYSVELARARSSHGRDRPTAATCARSRYNLVIAGHASIGLPTLCAGVNGATIIASMQSRSRLGKPVD
jgi:hypothetical protein